ncbi:MAG: hypothetical protein ABSB11_09555 [Sedimentisphaerales bacterium]|jgi:hypothetical protein
MNTRAIKYGFCFLTILLFAGIGRAEQVNAADSEMQVLRGQVAELQQQMKDANERHTEEMKLLREEIELLKHSNVAPPAAAPVQPRPVEPNQAPLPVAENKESPASIPQSSNPDISAIGDFIFHGGPTPRGETPDTIASSKTAKAQLREVEFGFSSPVDPYGRADLILSIERQDDGSYSPDIEEGYFTYTDLPYDLQARFGKFYSAFGKANTFHTHAMPWVDRPNVIRKFFGEEGLNDGGGEISWLVPNPWDNYMQLTFDLQNNGNDAMFAGDEAHSLMYVTHLKNFFDLDRSSSIEVGESFATGDNDANTNGGHKSNVEGLDLTYKWRDPQYGLYKSLTWMNEILFSQKEEGDKDTVNSHGMYSSLEYQFNREWSVFGRYDYTQFPDSSRLHETSYTTGLTFHQSEFMFWRMQFEHTDGDNFAGNVNRNEIWLQADFLIGLHPAHQY